MIRAKANLNLHIDQSLFLACSSLLSIGFLMVISSSLHLGAEKAHDITLFPLKQLIHILIGLMSAIFITQVPMQFWENKGQLLFIIGLALLLIVLIPGVGVRVNGSVRWISIIGFRLQVSEIMKFISVIYVAGYVTRHADHVKKSAIGVLKPLMLFSVACVLLLMEPDFGSMVVIIIIAMGMMFLGGARLSQFIIMLTLLTSIAVMLVIYEPYRMARVLSFTNPWEHARDSGFQLTQALIAFGRGEFFGVGLGNGIQKLFYLPEAHTDFLFSVVAEELGLLGVLVVIAMFSVMIMRAFAIGAQAEKCGQGFSALVAYGLAIWFGFQSFVNMGVNMGMLPTKGLTLPFMSYGGGSMVVMCAAVALLFRIHYEAIEHKKNNKQDTFK